MCVGGVGGWGYLATFPGVQNLPLGMSKDALSLVKQFVHKIKLNKNMHQSIYLSIYVKICQQFSNWIKACFINYDFT